MDGTGRRLFLSEFLLTDGVGVGDGLGVKKLSSGTGEPEEPDTLMPGFVDTYLASVLLSVLLLLLFLLWPSDDDGTGSMLCVERG